MKDTYGIRTFCTAIVVFFLSFVPGAVSPQRPESTARAGTSAVQGSAGGFLGTRFAGSVQPVRIHVNQYRNCFALAPADWSIYGERREGDALDIASPDMAASWSVVGVPGVLARFDPYRYGTPELQISETLSRQFKRQPVVYGKPARDDFGYIWLPYESGLAKGVVVYQAWPLPLDPPGYIVVRRFAQTRKSLWEGHGAEAIAVALSIRCTRQLQPSPDSVRGPVGDDKFESTYNQQLGMEYAHDPVTGDNYWVSSSADWHETGPEGAGYYRQSGNELRRLVPGRSE